MCSCTFASPRAAGLVRARRALQGLQVFQSEVSALEQVGHKQLRRAAEELEQIAHQSTAMLALIDGGLEELRVADLFYFAQGAFFFEAIDEGLDGGVGDAFVLGKAFEDFADGG